MSGAEGQTENQGYLGNLEKKSRAEIQDLLSRQEKLLKNEQFIKRLPDKGKRIRALLDRLTSMLALQSHVDDTAGMLYKMTIDADHDHRSRASVRSRDGEAQETDKSDFLGQIVNVGNVGKVVQSEEPPANTQTRTFINSYENVIRDVERKQVHQGGELAAKFQPSRSIKAQHLDLIPADRKKQLKRTGARSVEEMDSEASVGNTEQMNISKGQNLNDPSVSSSLKDNPDQELAVTEKGVSVNSPRSVPEKSLPGNRQLRHVYDDSLEMDMRKGPLHHAPAKMITIPESVRLLEKQQKLHKQLQAQHAAQRLTQRLHINIGDFNPEGAAASFTQYRQPAEEPSEEEASDAELDYPD